ncbi:unnamed protein product [Orchesella dallaii]|uniref:Uncharacterized protein n=1 Tax=Orchesella dallaii TaxID=48710 RepID=A0ABP1SB34_9HEXA
MYYFPSPELRLITREGKESIINYVKCPPALQSCGATANPFPSRSVMITGRTRSKSNFIDYLLSKCPLKSRMGLEKLGVKFGHHLTSLTLHRIRIFDFELDSLIRHMPNLKAVQFSLVSINESSSSSSVLSAELERSCKEQDECQIMSLQLVACNPLVALGQFNLGGLKQLKLFEPTMSIVSGGNVGSFSLQDLVVISLKQKKGICFDDALKLSKRFAKTLVNLHISVRHGEELVLESVLQFVKEGVTFPSLRKLGIPCPQGEDELQLGELINHILPTFPKLETLQLHRFGMKLDVERREWKNEVIGGMNLDKVRQLFDLNNEKLYGTQRK